MKLTLKMATLKAFIESLVLAGSHPVYSKFMKLNDVEDDKDAIKIAFQIVTTDASYEEYSASVTHYHNVNCNLPFGDTFDDTICRSIIDASAPLLQNAFICHAAADIHFQKSLEMKIAMIIALLYRQRDCCGCAEIEASVDSLWEALHLLTREGIKTILVDLI